MEKTERAPSLSNLTYDEFTKRAEQMRKAPVRRRNQSQPGRTVRKVVAGAVTVGTLVAAAMYAGAKNNEVISRMERAVVEYFSPNYNQNNTSSQEAANYER